QRMLEVGRRVPGELPVGALEVLAELIPRLGGGRRERRDVAVVLDEGRGVVAGGVGERQDGEAVGGHDGAGRRNGTTKDTKDTKEGGDEFSRCAGAINAPSGSFLRWFASHAPRPNTHSLLRALRVLRVSS